MTIEIITDPCEAETIIQIDYVKYIEAGKRYCGIIKCLCDILNLEISDGHDFLVNQLLLPAWDQHVRGHGRIYNVFISTPLLGIGPEDKGGRHSRVLELAEYGVTLIKKGIWSSDPEIIANNSVYSTKESKQEKNKLAKLEQLVSDAAVYAIRVKDYGLAMKLNEILVIDFGHEEES